MKFFSHFLTLTLLTIGLIAASLSADAQGFGLSVAASANSILVNNSLTYTINVTNLTGSLLTDAQVTNALPASAQILGTTTSQGTATVNGSGVLFDLGGFNDGGIAQMTVTAKPTTTGLITNTTIVTSISVADATNNVVIQVTNAVTLADLGVAITGPAKAVLVSDLMTYGVTVTNAGPNSAPNVFLTNTLPAGVVFKSVSPSQVITFASSNLIINLGTLANGSHKSLQFTVQPTIAGVVMLSASAGASLTDPNPANNYATSNITVLDFSGTLIATNVSKMGYYPQTGLMTNTIRLSNIGSNAVASARVIVSGLTNWLYNAVGTNNGHPFVVYGGTLDTNQSVDLVMEYFIPTRRAITISNSQYTAEGVPAVDFSAPPGTNGVFFITRTVLLANGSLLIEFNSVPGSGYTILYSDNLAFSNALSAQPSITAPADRTQWIDDGPPKTVSFPPGASGMRFYRVLQNQ